jgi:hypothetical protein
MPRRRQRTCTGRHHAGRWFHAHPATSFTPQGPARQHRSSGPHERRAMALPAMSGGTSGRTRKRSTGSNSRTRSEAASASARAWAAAPRRTRSAAATTRFWLSRSESWRSGRRAVSLACAARAEATSSCASASAALAAFAALNGAAFPDAAASTRRHARSSSAAATHRRRSAPCPRRPSTHRAHGPRRAGRR